MEIGECKTVYIKSLKEKIYALKYDEGVYKFNHDDRLIFWPDSDIIEISCQTCKFNPNEPCMCDSDHGGWIYGGDKMENKMPELKPGMVVKYEDGTYYIITNAIDKPTVRIDSVFKFYSSTFAYKIGGKINFNDLKLVWKCNPPTDWSVVKVDAKVLIEYTPGKWMKRYFAKYEDEIVYVFEDGCTSFTAGKTDDWFHSTVGDEVVLYEGNEHLVK